MKKFIFAGAAAFMGLASASGAQAATFTPADCTPGNIHFCVTGDAQAPGVDDVITAIITNTFTSPTSIDDTFLFRIDKSGVGSGGLQTSFSSTSTLLNISDLIINGVSYASQIISTGAGQSIAVNNIPITSGALNSIRVIGDFNGTQGNYTGNLTFNATVPEMGTWAMMILGMAAIGFAMRRRSYKVNTPKVSFA